MTPSSRSTKQVYKPSRFNFHTFEPDGTLLLYNSFTGAFFQIREQLANDVSAFLTGRSISTAANLPADLIGQGFFVPLDVDELARADLLHSGFAQSGDYLHLIIMPTEQCNFRCVYCYEDFARGRMRKETVEGIINLVSRRASTLKNLAIGWFGGEPLAAVDIVEQISTSLLEICDRHSIKFTGNITTNGYFLDPKRQATCFTARISEYQVTLDGPAETHDRLRVLAGGGPTYSRILSNLTAMSRRKEQFLLNLRVNYTPGSLAHLPDFIDEVGAAFAGDTRFQIHFHAVGKWGGPNDEGMETCEFKDAKEQELRLMRHALEAGFSLRSWRAALQPFGSVCYAASPHSLVVGSDGTLYKCTVAFRDPRNQIGRLASDGTVDVDDNKFKLWTESGEDKDTGCQQCAFRPACHGNLCPLERLNRGQKVCPPFKTEYRRQLPLLAIEARRLQKTAAGGAE